MGKQALWTDDPILAEYKFCNVYRGRTFSYLGIPHIQP